MDKRLLTALLLTAIVVAVTPILFPTPRRTPASATSTTSTTSATASQPSQTTAVSTPAPVELEVDLTRYQKKET